MTLRKVFLVAALMFCAKGHALCPEGSTFDSSLDFCATETDAFGPFTNAMVDKCVAYGGGSACTNTYTYPVQGTNIEVLRWSRGFTENLRGTGSCPDDTVRSPTYGGHCFEQVSGAENNVYGNFKGEEVEACDRLGGGTACYTNRWSANFYLAVKDEIANAPDPDPAPQLVNKFGVWLWYIDEAGLGRTHTQLADELAATGVKRIFIKIADGSQNCDLFADACSTTTTDIYRSRGIEPWAWSYNYPGNESAQADALYYAAKYGYVGFVLDVEVEFNNTTTELHSIYQAMLTARDDAERDGHFSGSFPIGTTTWGNPMDQGMNVGIIDQYVDFHMPQTYVEVWGQPYMQAAKQWIAAGNCEYREMGAQKPIWHIVSTEYDDITPAQLTDFLEASGPNTSIWRVPGGSVPQAVWDDWAALDWNMSEFDATDCNTGNNDLTDYLGDSGVIVDPVDPVDPPAPVAIPYWKQTENYYDPYGTCSITSLAMVTDHFGFTSPAANGRTPDYLYEELGGVLQTVPDLEWGFNQMAIRAGSSKRADSKTNGTIQELRDAVTSGKLAIVHGWFTNPGHIMVVTDFDGEYYTVNDPFGQWNLQKWGSYNSNVSGEGVRYPKDAFEYAINDNGTGDDLWLHIYE
ncbi:C39 family peptidase [Microbulbifer agarilyticus]|uniref:C39 family peptidase n=1 Tax=Microbulbifer agarilyticus TaxID=260552 RepID=UPI001C9506AA|nr:C39 family peptidase [Microbulbifer agarilyticus]MBY6191014.1 C39 family peptidase [Microbulbifer agarilyticus]